MIVGKIENGEFSFVLQKSDWGKHGMVGKAFLGDVVKEIPKTNRRYEQQNEKWVVTEFYRDRFLELVRRHFPGAMHREVERLLA